LIDYLATMVHGGGVVTGNKFRKLYNTTTQEKVFQLFVPSLLHTTFRDKQKPTKI